MALHTSPTKALRFAPASVPTKPFDLASHSHALSRAGQGEELDAMFQKRDDPYGSMEAGFGGNLSWAPGGHSYGANDFSDKVIRQGFIRKVFGMSMLDSAEFLPGQSSAHVLQSAVSNQATAARTAEGHILYTARTCSIFVLSLSQEHCEACWERFS